MKTALSMTASILKLRIGAFIALAAVVGILTGGGRLGWTEAAVFTLAVLGASAASGAFNQYFERKTDHLMTRTANRPFVTGQLREGFIWPLTFTALLAVSLVMGWAVGGTLAAGLVLLGALTYGFLYTLLLKRRTVWNVVIGGAAGSFALLAGAAASADSFGPAIGPVPLYLAAVLFLWTPPHFWALAHAKAADYRNAGIPMLPVVTDHDVWGPIVFGHVLLLAILSVGPLLHGLGAIYGVCAMAAGGWFLATSYQLMREPSVAAAWRTFAASLGYFALLSLGVILEKAAAWLS